MREEQRRQTIRREARPDRACVAARGDPNRSSVPRRGDGRDCRAGAWSNGSGRRRAGRPRLRCKPSRRCKRRGGTAAWIDADGTFDAAYAARLGVALDGSRWRSPDRRSRRSRSRGSWRCRTRWTCWWWTRRRRSTPEIELRTELGASGPGAQRRALASGLRRLAGALRSSGTAALFLNQTRASEQAETSAGGPALKLFAAARVSLRGIGGRRIRFRVLKNNAGGGLPGGRFAVAGRAQASRKARKTGVSPSRSKKHRKTGLFCRFSLYITMPFPYD